MNFGERVVAYMGYSRTQGDICRTLGLSPQFVSQICKGNKLPHLDSLEPWADMLGVSHAHVIKLVLQSYLDKAEVEATVTGVRIP